MQALDRAIAMFDSEAAFARALIVAPNTPAMWRRRQSVAALRCLDIYRITGKAVHPTELRPDVDWSALAD